MSSSLLLPLTIVLVIFSTTCDARLNTNNATQGRDLTLSTLTEAMAYIKFYDSTTCDTVVATWQDAPDKPSCIYQDYCASDGALRVLTTATDCEIEPENSPADNTNYVEYNNERFEYIYISTSGNTGIILSLKAPTSTLSWVTSAPVGNLRVQSAPYFINRLM
eukprot:CAMPEP_0201508320 /NCGR_PEP_ID=MMETSP0161_2-20130828/1728_1 /ASSEMBLY_ACC=CAM_ASM_000251 /TAXON_ID=180227 /ORGANISM="Neoparamoeba aestuarina, Strain SoJaBio B1-5/56/2" /LENGTH=162 /DNA_ID=CAMNT_0047902953 /DNA_START=79 /DNA_END=564 /DNA_ORIENTATION=-